jgi:DNA repair protein RadC
MLNRKNEVIGINTVSMGSLTASVVHPREVLCAVCAVVVYRYQR